MSNDHDHPRRIHYTIYMQNRHWWGGRVVYKLVGTGSSQQGSELLIYLGGDKLWSINYANVYRMVAIPEDTHSHP